MPTLKSGIAIASNEHQNDYIMAHWAANGDPGATNFTS